METSLKETISIIDDAKALGTAAADLTVRILTDAVRQRGKASVALSGGNTPQLYFPLLAAEPRRSTVPWDCISVFWTDERCVPPDHHDSNFGMAQNLMLSQIPASVTNIHRIHGELAPETAARLYDRELAAHFNGLPRFDLILLGIGNDGHTASLFPGTTALEAQEYACSVYVPHLGSWRVTLSMRVLNNARKVLYCAAGSAKKDILKTVLNNKTRSAYPAGRVMPTEGELIWLIDAAASG